jgi:monoamine oxidase
MSRSLYARLHRRFGARPTGAERTARVRSHLEATRPAFAPPGPKTEGGPRVAVIGGGFAGMAAAYRLSFQAQVTVYEARGRFGGRVHTLKEPEGLSHIEGGAELSGWNHPLWLMLNEQFGLGISMLTSEDNYASMGLDMPLRLMGHVVPPDGLPLIYQEMTDAFAAMGDQAKAIDPNAPWTAPNAPALDDRPLSDWIANCGVSDLTQAALTCQFANNNGAQPQAQSWLANLSLVAGGQMNGDYSAFFTETETFRCASGNDMLALILAWKVSENGGKCQLSLPCEAVDLTTTPARVYADGYFLEYDYVVLATPPSCWGRIPGLDLPPDYFMTMGTVVKYLSDVSTRFWFAEHQAPSSVADDFGMTWEGTDNQVLRPTELSLFAGGGVAQEALAVYDHDPNALPGFYDARIRSLYPGYQRSGPPRFMPWPREEWTWTGYSCPDRGDVCRVAPNLVRPYGAGACLYFAGEHTSPGFFGYMEGALQSGWRAAGQILDRL